MAKLENIRSIISQIKPQMQEVQATNKPQQPITNGSLAVDNKVLPLPETKPQPQSKNIMAILTAGKDYGSIPGVKGTVLFKSGAIKIMKHYGLKQSIELLDKTVNIPEKFISYTVKISLINASGEIVAEAFGSANSHERKFLDKGFSADSMLIGIAAKRALVSAVKDTIS